eukprot:TRINITY_DN4548_c0_g1_i1.p1 TRINITY_DN4548_c0_g1~~TRINITY_DN4548_c0_g1_i1.p1  ORF type:complete len:327 (+),score=93.84 TRINITY_DN4548_c0_g1_i1:173-1153(+)
MSVNVDVELKKFQEKWGLDNEEAIAGLKEELTSAAEVGSDDKKKEEVHDLIRKYDDAGFLKISKLGGGAYGEVYKAINLKTKELVAVKIIDLEESKDDILVIKREIDALADVSSCKQFVQYKGTHLLETKLWIVMEFVKGGSLGDILKKKGAVTEAQAAVVAREALLGLQHLHSNNRIHRDIKAANLLIQEDCQVKLGDLGATVQLTSTKPNSDTMIGSPYWMAPEVLRQDKHDGKADVWSLGITCIELVKGKPPNSHLPALRIVMLVPMSPAPKLEGDYSDTFKDFISQCLQKNPDTRPSVKDLLEHPFIQGAGELSELQCLLTS